MTQPYEAIVMGASSGAVGALATILPPLPAQYALPIVVVVHLPSNDKGALTGILKDKCRMQVKEAEDKEPLKPGIVYIAPPDYHLQVENDRTVSLSNEEPVLFSRPSIDILFETAADAYREALLGIILSGGNEDGAKGLKTIARAGGKTIVQNPASAFAAVMPQSALDACPDAQTMTLTEITEYLLTVTMYEHI